MAAHIERAAIAALADKHAMELRLLGKHEGVMWIERLAEAIRSRDTIK